MFLHFYYVNCKKEKKDYIIIYKFKNEVISFNQINSVLYSEFNNNTLEDKNINYYELFYIKEGLKIKYEKELWNNIINMYLNKLNIHMIIDEKYVEKLWNSNLLLFLIDKYDNSLKEFLISYYKNNFNKLE